MMKPLAGTRVLELASIGPGPHAAMQLADLGAEIVRIVRPGTSPYEHKDKPPLLRGRIEVTADLKTADGRDSILELVRYADVLIEGYRPGVAERLGLGPEDCLSVNRRLVYARATGWGQHGPLAQRAGHDINYVAITGVLHAIGTKEHPVLPLSLIGNYGGGAMFLVAGVLAALVQRGRTGQGEVLDVATVDGVCKLAQPILDLRSEGSWTDRRNDNLLDGGAPFYRTYACADGKHLAVGALEPQFYQNLLAGLGLCAADLPDQYDRDGWGFLAEVFSCAFGQHPREHWLEVFDQVDACVTPVLTFGEASGHPHLRDRMSLSENGGWLTAAPAPRFSASPEHVSASPEHAEMAEPARAETLSLAAILGSWRRPPDL